MMMSPVLQAAAKDVDEFVHGRTGLTSIITRRVLKLRDHFFKRVPRRMTFVPCFVGEKVVHLLDVRLTRRR